MNEIIHTKSHIYGSGVLNSIKLKKSDGYIYGNLSIRTGENNIVSFNVYQSEITFKGKSNPNYIKMLDVFENFKDSTSYKADYVEIKQNNTYPNAGFYFRNNDVLKSVKQINKCDTIKNCFIFKIYGIKINKNFENISYCTALSYDNKLTDFKIINNGIVFNEGMVYDVVGYINEGLREGVPIDELSVKKARISELKIDFDSGMKNIEESPF